MCKYYSQYFLNLSDEFDKMGLFKQSDFLYQLSTIKTADVRETGYVDYDYTRIPGVVSDPFQKLRPVYEKSRTKKRIIDPLAKTETGKFISQIPGQAQKALPYVGYAGGVASLYDVGKLGVDQAKKINPNQAASIAKQNPQAASKVQTFLKNLSTKFPKLGPFMGKLPIIGAIVMLYMSREEIAKYIDLIANGKFDQILKNKRELNSFSQLCLNLIGSALMLIPGAQPVATLLYGISASLMFGEMAYDFYYDKMLNNDKYAEEFIKTDYKAKTYKEFNDKIMPKLDFVNQSIVMEIQSQLADNPNLKLSTVLQPYESSYKFIKNPQTNEERFLRSQLTSAIMNMIEISKSMGERAKPTRKIIDPATINNILWSIISKVYLSFKPNMTKSQLALMDNKALYREINSNVNLKTQIENLINGPNYKGEIGAALLKKFYEKLRLA